MVKTGLITKIDRVPQVMKALRALSTTRVLVGIPATKAERSNESISNAVIGYLNEHGVPEMNLPARPHLVPGVKSVRGQIVALLFKAGQFALDGKPSRVIAVFNAAGSLAASAVRAKITAGLSPKLAASTIAGRMRRHKGRKDTDPKPLIDTGKYYRAITWVLRKR